MVTLPAVMALLDIWPFRRGISRVTLREKIPFAVLSAISAAITFFAQKAGGAIKSLDQVGPLLRIENAFVSWAVYPLKMLWPSKLAVLYPYPRQIPFWKAALCALAIGGVSAAAVQVKGRFPYLTVGWFWYLVTTLPVIGLIQVGLQERADRYMYIPMAGLAIAMAWGAADAIRHRPAVRIPVLAAGAAALTGWAACAFVQTGYWRNSEALFRHTVSVTNDNYVAWENLGSELIHSPGRLEEGIECLRSAIRARPEIAIPYGSLCGALHDAGRYQEALGECETAIRIDPGYWEARNNLGTVLASLGRTDEAIAQYRAALRINPSSAETHGNLGSSLSSQGKLPEAVAEFDAALALAPESAANHYYKGAALLDMGNPRGATDEFEEALNLNPDYAEAHSMMGAALLGLPGGSIEAFPELAAALRLNPNLASAHANLALALSEAGRDEEALAQIRTAVGLEPGAKWAARLAQIEAKSAKGR